MVSFRRLLFALCLRPKPTSPKVLFYTTICVVIVMVCVLRHNSSQVETVPSEIKRTKRKTGELEMQDGIGINMDFEDIGDDMVDGNSQNRDSDSKLWNNYKVVETNLVNPGDQAINKPTESIHDRIFAGVDRQVLQDYYSNNNKVKKIKKTKISSGTDLFVLKRKHRSNVYKYNQDLNRQDQLYDMNRDKTQDNLDNKNHYNRQDHLHIANSDKEDDQLLNVNSDNRQDHLSNINSDNLNMNIDNNRHDVNSNKDDQLLNVNSDNRQDHLYNVNKDKKQNHLLNMNRNNILAKQQGKISNVRKEAVDDEELRKVYIVKTRSNTSPQQPNTLSVRDKRKGKAI